MFVFLLYQLHEFASTLVKMITSRLLPNVARVAIGSRAAFSTGMATNSPRIKLYTNPISPPGRSVELTAKAIDLDIEVIAIDLLGNDTLKPDYLLKNPQHTIPMIDDGGKFIWDSQAINVYLTTVYSRNEDLYPNDPFVRAKVNAGLHFNSGVLFSRLKLLISPVIRGFKQDLDPEKVEYFNIGLQLLEDTLHADYYIGNRMTLADLSCVSSVSSFDAVLPISHERFPKTVDWLRRMEQLPYYGEANGEGAKKLAKVVQSFLK
ncbi:glutathione S-transferase 1 [Aedes aegypti]|uniref:glutathione transferase n=1 Tax=Aedes aegypti TaxID=7159 RepID=A0A6I8TF13_AEDAE|nr:glutathione S-transferase 1 [Aedes aegypti]